MSKLILDRVNRKSVTSLTTLPQKVAAPAICLSVAHALAFALPGQTPIGARLRRTLNAYVPKIEDPSLYHKPISILVITDGVPSKSLDRLGADDVEQ
jgi:uncharacterized protein YegL